MAKGKGYPARLQTKDGSFATIDRFDRPWSDAELARLQEEVGKLTSIEVLELYRRKRGTKAITEIEFIVRGAKAVE
jgi:hypothetical protein